MRFLLFTLLAQMILGASASPQIEPYGLDTQNVSDLRWYGGTLYASTDNAGVFRRERASIGWESIGLTGKNIRSVYPHAVGPIGFAVTVGVEADHPGGDSTVVYCWSGGQWIRTDTGMNHSTTWEIRSVDGIPTPQICGETFAVGSGRAFVRKNRVWDVIHQGMVLNVVRVSPNNTIWIGGESLIFWPYLAKSNDLGATWIEMFPDLAGDNACNSIAFHPTDSNVVYAGMEGVVIKTTDGGATWKPTGLQGTPFYFRGLAVDPTFPKRVYAGGVARPDSFGLFETIDEGETWRNIPAPKGTHGISSLAVSPFAGNEVYVSTRGTGVFKFTSELVGVDWPTNEPGRFGLYNCFPNPFNPVTQIVFRNPERGFVSLDVFDLQGRKAAMLVGEVRDPGEYQAAWDAEGFPSGVYFCRLSAGSSVAVKKLMLIR